MADEAETFPVACRSKIQEDGTNSTYEVTNAIRSSTLDRGLTKFASVVLALSSLANYYSADRTGQL